MYIYYQKKAHKMIITNKSSHCHCCHCDDCLHHAVAITVADDNVVVVSSFDTLADLFNTYFTDGKRSDREREKELFLLPSMTKAESLPIVKSTDGVVGLKHQ